MKEIIAVVAATADTRGIGYKGQLPWKLPADMAHFKRVTTGSGGTLSTPPAVIMGRKTWESIPPKFRPLPGRRNVVLSTTTQSQDYPDQVLLAASLFEAIQYLEHDACQQIFIIGGAQVYKEAIDSRIVQRVIYTEVSNIPENLKFDAFFPALSKSDWDCQPFYSSESDGDNPADEVNDDKENGAPGTQQDEKSGLTYKFLDYTRIPEGPELNPEEMQYLDLCRDIIENGVHRGDRTGTGTLSKFGTQMRFSLRDGTLPLLTTKRTFWRGVAEELLWFISGNTNGNDLSDKGIHIWDGNGSREFLDQRGLSHRDVGDLGPVYGFQWRHFGAKYVDMHTDYTGQGVDQLADCIWKIRNAPEDRRIIMSAWNPADLNEMALPPCHMFCQFYVANGELSCQMYQRSADMGLGVPFNIASYSLLTHMMAHVCGLAPGDFIHTIGDAHVYLNHVDALQEQLKRAPRAFPKLIIHNKDSETDIDGFVFDDFEVVGYKPHGTIKMKMAV
ncbi:Thymidylate synthase [Fragilaria crotonensis]|nr:Thymidylate synthase [Fragilaria crotonensis]